MNVERTIEFILNSQAKAEARMDKTDKEIVAIRKLLHQGMRILVSIENAQKRTEARVAELARTQNQLAQTQNELAQAQKKTEAAMVQSQKRTDTATADLKKSMAELAEAQKETQRSLKAFLDSMRHRRNGA